ncbi:MAG: helix-hairpin-helix domain-containing protein [Planctomycetota bacterium]
MNPPLDAPAVASLLTEIGQRMELTDEPPFKVRAYYAAAETLAALPTPLHELVAHRKLRDLPGVGEALAEKIARLHLTGSHPTLDFLRTQMPAGVLDFLKVSGLGPKKAALLYKDLRLSNLEELEAACRAGRLRDCKGLGEALEKKVLQGLEFLKRTHGLQLVHSAEELAQFVCVGLAAEHPRLRRVVPAGPLRRGCEVVDYVCIVAESPDSEEDFLQSGVRVFLSFPRRYGVVLLFATGGPKHLEELCALAASKGIQLSEKGLWRSGGEICAYDEEAVYAALELPFIEPELREGLGEIALAAEGRLPHLVRREDIRGILHAHTVFSDGADTLPAMAEAVRARGCEYFGVAEHSQSAGYAGGLKEANVRAQHELIDELNAQYEPGSFRIFKGIESDIRDDGALDYPPDILRRFDFIVASVHSRFNFSKEQQTARLIAAVADPHTTIVGHLTGRLLLQREAYKVDVDAVLQACARQGVAVEINAHPHRLDLDWRWHRRALELGCMLSINPDAHSIPELGVVRWGVAVARKGGVPKERILNCMELGEITRWFEARRRKLEA